jgi:hypothetical protein
VAVWAEDTGALDRIAHEPGVELGVVHAGPLKAGA